VGLSTLHYQWFFNATNRLDGSTNLTLTLNSVTAANAGTYSMIVSNSLGALMSSPALLSVYNSAAATLNSPLSISGDSFQFDVSGVPGFTYAIETSTNLIDWLPVLTNLSPFTFVTTNVSAFPQRFQRAVYVP
jgi:hypothetical protein